MDQVRLRISIRITVWAIFWSWLIMLGFSLGLTIDCEEREERVLSCNFENFKHWCRSQAIPETCM